MPELPEVETTVRALRAKLLGVRVTDVEPRVETLRWPLPTRSLIALRHQTILDITRRAKYIVMAFKTGSLLIHLGMSGTLRLLQSEDMITSAVDAHTHCIVHTTVGSILFRDPRKFGAILWQAGNTLHPRLVGLGVEPLTDGWSASYLLHHAKRRRLAVKQLLMNQAVVVGIGNIYAAEALFLAGVRPRTPAMRVGLLRAQKLVTATKNILTQAIACGGTSIRDFYSPDNRLGYFVQRLYVYGRAAEPCFVCQTPIVRQVHAQRSDFFCRRCQR